jgi:hypothetical protein
VRVPYDEGVAQLLAAAAASPVLKDVYVEGLSPAPQIELIVDREKAAALGVTLPSAGPRAAGLCGAHARQRSYSHSHRCICS